MTLSTLECAKTATQAAAGVHMRMQAATAGADLQAHSIRPLATGTSLSLVLHGMPLGSFDYQSERGAGLLFGMTRQQAEDFAERICSSFENLSGHPEKFFANAQILTANECENFEREIDLCSLAVAGAAWRLREQCGVETALPTLDALSMQLDRLKSAILHEQA